MNLKVDLYRDYLKALRIGTKNGRPAVSKPLLLLSIISLTERNILKENKIFFDSDKLKGVFRLLAEQHYGKIDTPFLPFFIRPFFHMDSEPFYELVWKGGTKPPTNSHTPSAKFLRENLEYAKLDDDLWELLQVPQYRAYLKQAIIDRYLK